MPDWQERIDRETQPAIRAEHELRYAAAAPIVHGGAVWCDLGCGTGIAAAAGLGSAFEGTAVLVDRDGPSVERARATVEAREHATVVADLADPADLRLVRERLLAAGGAGEGGGSKGGAGDRAASDGAPTTLSVTCFETVEHLATFVPLVELLVELADRHGATVVLSVPNDALWAIENPHHATTWGDGAVEELRGLLPAGHVVARQVALHGSALAREDESTQEVAMVSATASVPTHYVIAFGPRADQLAMTSRVLQVDLDEQRRWERQRESDVRYYAAELAASRRLVEQLQASLREREGRPET